MKSQSMDGLARRLVQRAYQIISGQLVVTDTLDSRFIYEAYLRVKEILTANITDITDSPTGDTTLVSNLAICLYMVALVWIREGQATAGIFPQLREAVDKILAEPSYWQDNEFGG